MVRARRPGGQRVLCRPRAGVDDARTSATDYADENVTGFENLDLVGRSTPPVEQCTERSSYVAGYLFWLLKGYKERDGDNQEYDGISVMGMVGVDSTAKRLVYDEFASART